MQSCANNSAAPPKARQNKKKTLKCSKVRLFESFKRRFACDAHGLRRSWKELEVGLQVVICTASSTLTHCNRSSVLPPAAPRSVLRCLRHAGGAAGIRLQRQRLVLQKQKNVTMRLESKANGRKVGNKGLMIWRRMKRWHCFGANAIQMRD